MTARNPWVEFGVENRACAVIDRANNNSVVLRTTFPANNRQVVVFWTGVPGQEEWRESQR
jgi:hypothetical protein